MKIKVTRSDAVWSYLATLLSMGANIIVASFALGFLNDNDTALYYIFSSLSAIASLFDLGFSPAMARSMAYAWSGAKELKKNGVDEIESNEPNYYLMLKVSKACKYIYTILSLSALFLALSVGTIYIKYITSIDTINDYLISWYIYALAIFLNILYSYYSVFLRGIGCIKKINMATFVSKLIQVVACIMLLMFGLGLIGVSVAYLLYGFVFRLLAKYWFYNYGDIRDNLRSVKVKVGFKEAFEIVKTIWPNTWRDGIVTLSNYFLDQATTIIASLYLTLQETGIYSLAIQLTTVIATVAATMYTTYQPALQSAYVNRDEGMQKKYMSLIVVSYVGLFIVGMLALSTIGLPIVRLIKPSYDLSLPLVIIIGLYQFLLKLRNCYTSYISTTNRVTYWKSFFISAVTCVVLSCLFAGACNLGVYGLLAAQLISQLMYNAWHWPLVVHRELRLSIVNMCKSGLVEAVNLVMGKTYHSH